MGMGSADVMKDRVQRHSDRSAVAGFDERDEIFLGTQAAVHLKRVEVKTLFIEPGSPWEIGYVESFNGKLRDELLNREVFDTLLEAKVLIERWRRVYNTVPPHSSLGYQPPVPEAIQSCSLAEA
jgi:putative transposase